MTNKRLTKSIKKFSKRKEDKLITISGMLGLPLDGSKTVEVPNRDSFVFVRLKDNTSEVIQAYNAEVSPIYDLPVLVTRQGNVYKVIGRNLELYRDWGNVPYLPKHGGQHSFNPSVGMGADVTWVYSQQFMPLLAYPSGSSMMLTVNPHVYEWEGQWKYAQNTGTPSFTPFVPTVTGSARMVLLYIDGRDNSLNLAGGTPFSNSVTDPATLFTFLPDVPRTIGIPLAAVKLATGTTSLDWDNIYDVRDFFTVGAGASGTSSTLTIWDEGVLKGTVTTLNVVGTNTDISVSGSVARLFITGSVGATESCGTYLRTERAVPLGGSTGTLFKVPDNVYASGSLGYFYNGLMQYKGEQYEELVWVSGTFQLLFIPALGAQHMVVYGVPCVTQSYSSTGSSPFDLADSDSVLLLDSDDVQLLDSDG